MKIVVVGAGPVGIITSILIKRKYPLFDVVILEQLDKPLKKLKATGNGKCNFLNKGNLSSETYSNIESLITLQKYNCEKIIELFHSFHIFEKYINDLAYPITESSISVINNLLNECKANNIEIKLSTKVIDYQVNEKIKIITNNGDILCDKLIFSTGGKSSPKLGSDGTLFEIFNNHHYQINELKPGLCPIKTKENTKILDGTRIKGKVSLWDNDNVIYEENGEILFKDHGLSGIVIFNISSIIARFNYQYKLIKLDILPNVGKKTLEIYLSEHGRINFLNAFIHPNMQKYLEKVSDNDLVNYIKNMPFHFTSSYGFDYSQVTIGGIKYDNLNNYQSKFENNVYFVGEVLDNDGLCGGYNLMYFISTAMELVDHL